MLALVLGCAPASEMGSDGGDAPAADPAAAPAPAGDTGNVGGCAASTPSRTLQAGPGDYRDVLATLGPGDLLLLEAGTYTEGLPLSGANGVPGSCIHVEGPEVWPPSAVFTVTTCCNTVSLQDFVACVVPAPVALDHGGEVVTADHFR
jgi:hypothetical protein